MSAVAETKKLRIAMQKSGRLSQDTQALLTSCGLKLNVREQRLIAHVENMDIDLLRVRDDDIPGLVMDGVCDLGIVGENVLEEVSLQRQLDNETYDYTVLTPFGFWWLPLVHCGTARRKLQLHQGLRWSDYRHDLPAPVKPLFKTK